MIPDPQRRAICRIYVPGTKARGTGFLVEATDGAKLVLTAAHVVRAKPEDATSDKYAGADIELEFGNPGGPPPEIVAGVSVAGFDKTVDGAVLKLPDKLPAGVQLGPAFQLRVLSSGYEIPWETYGYSNAAETAGKLGLQYGGTVRTQDPQRYQLQVDQVWGDPSGLSGAPCIVDGQAVAIILKTQTTATTETLFARCTGIVGKALGLKIQPPVIGYTNYINWVTFRLQDFGAMLRQTFTVLGLGTDAAAQVEGARLPERIAEGLMRGMKAAVDGIRSLKAALLAKEGRAEPSDPPVVAREIFDLSTRTWIDDKAITKLADVLKKGDKIVLLNTSKAEIAAWYVHRAGCTLDNYPGAFEYATAVDLQSIAPAVMLDDFKRDVAAKLGRDPSELVEALAEHDHEGRPLVVWLALPPKRADLEQVRGADPAFQKIRVIILAGPDIPDDLKADYDKHCEIIEPFLIADQETKALELWTTSDAALHRIFNPKYTIKKVP